MSFAATVYLNSAGLAKETYQEGAIKTTHLGKMAGQNSKTPGEQSRTEAVNDHLCCFEKISAYLGSDAEQKVRLGSGRVISLKSRKGYTST